MNKKRHHYIPKAYLKFFWNDSGTVLVYRKDDPSKAISLSPDNTGFHKYYYSQPRPDGGKDHNAFEDCFSIIETNWLRIVDQLHRRENVNDSLVEIFGFMALQRVRVPASRDVSEMMLAEVLRRGLARWTRKENCHQSLRALKTSLTTLKYLSTRTNRFTP